MLFCVTLITHEETRKSPRGRRRAYHLVKHLDQIRDEDMLAPSAIAETYWHLAHQDPSAWTLDIDVRPFKENW